jgi:hypothetical protein
VFCFVGFGGFSAVCCSTVCVLVVVSCYEAVLVVGCLVLLVFLVLSFNEVAYS